MPRFLVTRAPGPAWDHATETRKQAGWNEHAAFMDALADAGFVAFGGPAGDENKVVLVVDAPDEATIRARLDLDSWAGAGLLVTEKVDPWTIWLGGDERLDPTPPIPLYLVAYGPGPAWALSKSRRDQTDWNAHGEFMDALVGEGVVIVGGPIDDRRAVLVMHERDPVHLRARLTEDPWYERVVAIEQIAEWSLWLSPRRPGGAIAT
jgi:uncharacterized protein YciI